MMMAELDIVGILLGIAIGIFLGGGVGFFIASWTNIFWRAKFMRNSMKKEVFIFRMISKDKRSMREMLVDVNDDIKILGEKAFICEKGRVWRTSIENLKIIEDSKKPTSAPKMDEMAALESGNVANSNIDKSDGFYLEQPDNSKKVKWEQEIPILYIDDESFRPLEITELKTESKVTAEQLGQMVTTFINIQVQKRLAKKTTDFLMILVAAGFVLTIFMVFSLTGKVEDLNKDLAEMNGRITTIIDNTDTSTEGGSENPVIIRQMPMVNDYGVLSSAAT
jgi:hypothetical protein